MVFDETSFTNFANRSSSKWRRYAPDVLPMHVAEMDFEVAEPIRETLKDLVDRSDLGYTGPVPEVANAFASYAKKTWNWTIDKTSLKLATDVGVAAVEVIRAVSKPGDYVLINSPVYYSFYGWIAEVGTKVFDVPLVLEDNDWKLDLPGIERAFEQGVKTYLMCSPQNPVGRIHSAQELAEVARLARKHNVLVISDEIHAPLSFEEFTPYLTLGEDAELTGVTITSSSKAWNTAGLKAAFLLTQSTEVAERLKSMPEAMHWRTSLTGAFAMATSFTEGVSWMEQTVERLKANREILEQELTKQLPKAKFFNHRATYLAWIDLAEYGIANPQQKILRDGKVAVVPGPDHAPNDEYASFVRFNFATSPERIREAVRRMKLALES
jgi:cysteine-S-conjugate beta-lyase